MRLYSISEFKENFGLKIEKPEVTKNSVRFGENKQGAAKAEAKQGHERAFDSDDGEARRRREMRMKRFKQLEVFSLRL